MSERVIGRMSVYRRVLAELQSRGVAIVRSQELAERTGGSAAQVRRDLMAVGYNGRPTRGYEVPALAAAIAKHLDGPELVNAAIVGVGNLGRALLAYFGDRRPNVRLCAGFDLDPQVSGRVISGCRIHAAEELPRVVAEQAISLALVVVPAAVAQQVADQLVACGVRALVNFAPVPLRVPPAVHVVTVDMTMALDQAVFYSRQPTP
jgi:redox-sensing transcriptional repressor